MHKITIITNDNIEMSPDVNIIKKIPYLLKEMNKYNTLIKIDINTLTLTQIINYIKITEINENNNTNIEMFINKISGDMIYNIIIAAKLLEMNDLVKIMGNKIRNLLNEPNDVVEKYINV